MVSVVKTPEDQIVAQVSSYAAIRATSENKANAYNFLKILLSEEIQTDSSVIFHYPVLNGSLDAVLEAEKKDYVGGSIVDEISSEVLFYDDAPIDDYKEMAGRVDRAVLPNQKLYGIVWSGKTHQGLIWEEFEPYFKDDKTYEQCLADFENKIELYISE